jgi:hypothetical protein
MPARVSSTPRKRWTCSAIFHSILTHSLDAEAMLKQFLQFLREILSVNRAAIFLNRPCSPLTEVISPEDSRRLRSAAAIGLASGLLEHFELSLDSGIGAQVTRLGRILRRDSDEARADGEAQKEFELLGAQVAVPIPNRDTIIGVAIFDGRVTGEPLVNVELELIFHLLEQVGLALRNIWLHDQLAGNHEMMTDVLRELKQRVHRRRARPQGAAREQGRAPAFWPQKRTHRQAGIQRPAARARRKNLPGFQDRRGAGTVPLRAGKFAQHGL